MAPEPVLADIDPAREQLLRLLEEIRRGYDEIIKRFNQLVQQASVDENLRMFASRIRGGIEKLLDVVIYVIDNGFPVVSLFEESLRWLTDVRQPASDIAVRISDPQDDNLHGWLGNTGAAYREKAAVQRQAIDKFVENCALISKWLFDIGKQNVDYAVGLLKTIAAVIYELVKALKSPGKTGLDFSGVIDKLVDAAINEVGLIITRVTEALGRLRDLLEPILNHAPYRNGDWPQAVHLAPLTVSDTSMRTT